MCEDNSWIHGKCRHRFIKRLQMFFLIFFLTFFYVFNVSFIFIWTFITSMTLSIHAVLGLSPGKVPWIMLFSRDSFSPRVMWPNARNIWTSCVLRSLLHCCWHLTAPRPTNLLSLMSVKISFRSDCHWYAVWDLKKFCASSCSLAKKVRTGEKYFFFLFVFYDIFVMVITTAHKISHTLRTKVKILYRNRLDANALVSVKLWMKANKKTATIFLRIQ